MPNKNHIFTFGRLNLIGTWEDDRLSKHSFINKALSSDVFITKGKFKYGIFQFRDIDLNGEKIAFGFLVKYKLNLESEVVDENNKKIQEDIIPKGVVGKSDFFLHYRSEIIAFREIPNKISEKQFRDIFSSLIEAGQNNLLVFAKIELIVEDFHILEAFQKFDVINNISIKLNPTNPNNRRLYKNIDERIKNLGASEYREEIESKDKGLNKIEVSKDNIFNGIIMSIDGYGESKISGIMDGKSKTIYSGEMPVKQNIHSDINPEEKIKGLYNTFIKIMNRKKHNEY